jgi:hypothetical protein
MVSNALPMELAELLATLRRIRREYGETPEYQAWRREFPKDWPI